MDVTPHELRTVEFREAWRGYRPDDVDDLLDRVAATLELRVEQVQQLTARLEHAESEARHGQEVEEMLRRTLLLAQQTADEAVAAAEARARALVDDAEARANAIMQHAESDAVESGAAQRRRIDREMTELGQLRDQLLVDVEALEKFEEEYRGRIRAMVEADLAVLDQRAGVTAPPRPAVHDIDLPAPAVSVDVREATPAGAAAVEAVVAEVPSGPAAAVAAPAAGEARRRTEPLDDDEFFASLREAVNDDTPLGPRDEVADSGAEPATGRFGALFHRRG